jgi:hypothetical protein
MRSGTGLHEAERIVACRCWSHFSLSIDWSGGEERYCCLIAGLASWKKKGKHGEAIENRGSWRFHVKYYSSPVENIFFADP